MLRKLKEDVEANFIEKGENKEHMTIHEFGDVDGNMQATPIVSMIGGVIA